MCKLPVFVSSYVMVILRKNMLKFTGSGMGNYLPKLNLLVNEVSKYINRIYNVIRFLVIIIKETNNQNKEVIINFRQNMVQIMTHMKNNNKTTDPS